MSNFGRIVLFLLAFTAEYAIVSCAFLTPYGVTGTNARMICLRTPEATSGLTSAAMLNMVSKEEEDLIRVSKTKRSADINDRVVTLNKPLGVVLNQDENGNVYVETLAPRGNAARSGLVKEGDYVVMCSATFGDELWSTRGVGLSRVLNAIKVRSGNTVKLVFESPGDSKKKALMTSKAAKAAEEAKQRAQEKRDKLLRELEEDEQRLKKGKFLGLF